MRSATIAVGRETTGMWRAAVVLGLLTGAYSTLVASLGAESLAARSAEIDWMVVGTIPLRATAIDAEPTWRSIIAGIVTYQAADLSWALAFFGLSTRLVRDPGPDTLIALALPWAAVISAVEYYAILPWLQPVFVLQQPYWVGLAVHALATFGYPLFPWLRRRVAHSRRSIPGGSFGPRWAGLMAAVAGAVLWLAALHALGLDPRWPWLSPEAREAEQSFMRRMTAQHERGTTLANLAVQKGTSERGGLGGVTVRDLGELTYATEQSQMGIMHAFWRSWYGGDVPTLEQSEYRALPGTAGAQTLAVLSSLRPGPAFEREFLRTMIEHHRGAAAMADQAFGQMTDLRLKALASAIAHAQGGQVAVMRDLLRRYDAAPSGMEGGQ